MKNILIFACAVVFSSSLHFTTGDDSKIVGGFNVYLKNVPFATSLQYKGMHFCGGSLLTLSHVLTGCHCLTFIQKGTKHKDVRIRNTRELTVVVGTENIYDSYSEYHQWRNIKEIKIHPECSFVQVMVYDFGVGCLESPLEESVKVRPFTLYALNKDEYDQKTKSLVNSPKSYCYVAGWGTTDQNVPKANPFIKAARMRLITDEECRKHLGRENFKFAVHNFAESGTMCSLSYGYHKNESDCAGDSGGPFFCGSVVYGVVSFGYDCGNWDSPNVYGKVSYAVEWLLSLDIFPKNETENNRNLNNQTGRQQPKIILMVLLALIWQ